MERERVIEGDVDADASVRRVVLHAGQRLVLEGLRLVCDGEPSLEVVGATTSTDDVPRLCAETRPHVVLLDVDDAADPHEVARQVLRTDKLTRLVAVRRSSTTVSSMSLRRAGYRALVDHADGLSALLEALHVDNLSVVTPMSRRPVEGVPVLTAREHDVLLLIAHGCSTFETSRRLGISAKTVENHKQRMFRKLDVQSQAHAVAVAMRHGMLRRRLALEA